MADLAIEIRGLRKRFGDVLALDGIDMEVEAGTAFGVLGPNGAGKTTVVRTLATILRPDAGAAKVLGHDVTEDPEAVRASIGLAGQYAAVDENLTGRENLQMIGRLMQLPRRVARQRADELVDGFDLAQAANRLVRTYSGGMRRRLDVAAALVSRPPVLFFDEPTTGLDPRSRNELWRVIGELVASGTTVLLTTQYLEEADRLAHRIAVIDEGRVIAEGSPAELKAGIGTTVLKIGFVDEKAADGAAALLCKIGSQRPRRDGTSLEVDLRDGTRSVIDVMRVMDYGQLIPTTLTLTEPTLDDVFLSLTGRHVRRDYEQDDI